MFEHFTDRAQCAVALAQGEAELLHHDYIGTEHILVGLIHENEGIAANVLKASGVSLDAVRGRVLDIIGQGQQQPVGDIPFTPRAKKVMEMCLRESLMRGHNYIGTEHILLALIREGEGVAMEILSKIGVNPVEMRNKVDQVMSTGKLLPVPDSDEARRPGTITCGEARLGVRVRTVPSRGVTGFFCGTTDESVFVSAVVTVRRPDGSLATGLVLMPVGLKTLRGAIHDQTAVLAEWAQAVDEFLPRQGPTTE